MVGRAEFAYLIAEMAQSAHIMKKEVFSIIIWALLYATIFAPFCFRKVLQRYSAKLADDEIKKRDSIGDSMGPANTLTEGWRDLVAKGGPGQTAADGHYWAVGDLTAFRFQIVYPKSAPSCNVEDLAEIWGLLSKQNLVITDMVQQCDHDTHFTTFQVQAEDGGMLEGSELDFIQQEIFRELKGVGAHIIFLPPLHSLQNKCKLAKITVIADLQSGVTVRAGAVVGISSIIDAVITKSFYIMRAGLEVHGDSCIFTFLVAHNKSLLDHTEQNTSGGAEASGEKTPGGSENVGSVADVAMDHLHMGTSAMPDILPEELIALKRRIEANALPEVTRVNTLVCPMTYSQGPLGELSHDAKALMEGSKRKDFGAAEIRFTMTNLPTEMFSRVLQTLATSDVISIISARLDERSSCQIMMVIAAQDLTTDLEHKVLDQLKKACEELGAQGKIDLGNLDSPLDKQYRELGDTTQSAIGDSSM
jgi:hypothetical protein